MPAEDETKAGIYGKCANVNLRRAILEGPNVRGDDVHTIERGMKDEDGTCRFIAYEKVSPYCLKPEALESLLEGRDTDALFGLANNHSLSRETLNRVGDRLSELGSDPGAWAAVVTRMDLEKTSVPDNPEELFGRWRNYDLDDFLHPKINAIGVASLKLHERLDDAQRGLRALSDKIEQTAVRRDGRGPTRRGAKSRPRSAVLRRNSKGSPR